MKKDSKLQRKNPKLLPRHFGEGSSRYPESTVMTDDMIGENRYCSPSILSIPSRQRNADRSSKQSPIVVHSINIDSYSTKLFPKTMDETRFQGKTVVITGAGGNFGREGCLYFTQRGAKVAALDKNLTSLQETIQEIKDKCNVDILSLECDVTSPESVQNVVAQIVEQFGSINYLWNNAGYQGQIKPTLEYDPGDFAMVMNINVTGMFVVLQAVGRQMAKQETGGSIVNTSSVAGLRGTPAMVAYSSSKAAVLAMTVSTAKDLAPYNIRVNAVSPALIGPGFMWTRQNELHAASGSPYYSSDPDEVAKGKINSVPMKRLGSVEEVVKSVAFLLSDEASYTTATNLVVDGGMAGGLKA